MAMHNPAGRANYEPNSWTKGGPRADPKTGFRSYPEEISGEKRKVRAELFADHYSQARQFYQSQTKVEQGHIADALVFELSKVETKAIRERTVAHLPNIDTKLAQQVSDGLGLKEVPKAHDPARPVVEGLKPSPALSIQKNGPNSFAGRKLGVLLTDGVDDALIASLEQAVEAAGGMVEFIAMTIGGIETSTGRHIDAQQKIDGGPSVLYDAVAVLATSDGVTQLKGSHPAKCFAADAFAHAKFIGLSGAARELFKAVGIKDDDAGMIDLDKQGAKPFVKACAALRFWDRLK
jgi:catalase